MDTTHSQVLFQEAKKIFAGGVNSPVRAFRGVDGEPLFIERGEGAYVYDADGNRFLDYVLSWGPLILGHAAADVVQAIATQAENGTSFGAPCRLETRLAKRIGVAMPHIEMLRFVNSGTEATMSALRLARAYTERNKIVKFAGCYHGHADALLVKAGSGVATLGLPDSPGVTKAAAADTLTAEYNDVDGVATVFDQHGADIAAVIVEPVAGNMGVVPPAPGFLQALRDITTAHNALLIFDEVMTGFRIHPNGAYGRYRIKADLTCLGKVIGGGLPVGAYGGDREIMELVAPAGPVYQAGTLSGNPIAMAAGMATLDALAVGGTWEQIEATTTHVASVLADAADTAGVPVQVHQVGTMFSTFFTDQRVTDWASVQTCDTERFKKYFRGMLTRGVYFAPSAFEASFVSLAHGPAEIDATADAARAVFAS